MGMYLSVYRKVGKKFEPDYRWDNSKWSMRYEMFEIISENGICVESDADWDFEKTTYYRPIDFKKCREELKKLGVNVDVFGNLLDLLEKDEHTYVSYG